MPLNTELRDALRDAAATARLLIACDYDGTLAPLVSDPGAAVPHPAAVGVFTGLAALPHTSTALISGRARADLAALSGMPDSVELVGSHGAEFASGFAQPLDADARQRWVRLRAALGHAVAGRAGAALEEKPASIAVHVRNATPEVGAAVLDEVSAGPARWEGIQVTKGKAVLELAVIDTDKGSALELLRAQCDATAVVYFGDDVTDEKAFARLGPTDVGVKVGAGETAAGYRVERIDDVIAALRLLLDSRH